jgi:hypothetical protein
VINHLDPTPLAAHAHQIAHAISSGGAAHALAATPASLRGLVAARRARWIRQRHQRDPPHRAIVAFADAAASLVLVLVRERDFIITDDTAMALAG